ncbi:RNA-binding (RRM/RBD/RNP motifs) family protein [Striga hermonthica]|uniref:RNA-binding (RRM/RBD/RNP motifs) family protein n=1 Tax=Striga hermonthica TaxID=68872 RepID=A0A9N7NJJ5_STRHE|nr:RNA-binding (RRM/RBD/RNP motifs) family protein [Striga hermonthica]
MEDLGLSDKTIVADKSVVEHEEDIDIFKFSQLILSADEHHQNRLRGKQIDLDLSFSKDADIFHPQYSCNSLVLACIDGELESALWNPTINDILSFIRIIFPYCGVELLGFQAVTTTYRSVCYDLVEVKPSLLLTLGLMISTLEVISYPSSQRFMHSRRLFSDSVLLKSPFVQLGVEMEVGKLFIGGICWETNEERLREHFEAFGEVLEAVIMRDRVTGRARGFGFVVFSDSSVAERVVREKHVIDGRTVEAKKAVPRDDHQTPIKNNSSSSSLGSLSPNRTKKIFVGGLPSTITELDFKKYFSRFGTIIDVVVMYDHNTQRPRGFGFITYDSEESVDKVLVKTFHELNGKMVEVKRAIPKEPSPGPARSPSSGFFNSFSPGHSSLNSMRTAEGRFSHFGRVGYPPYSPGGNQSMGSNSEDSGLRYRYGSTDYSYFGGNYGKNGSFSSTLNRDVWGNVNLGEGWGGSSISAKGRENILYGSVQDSYDGLTGYTRDNGGFSDSASLFSGTDNVRDKGFGNLYGGDSFYSDHIWHSLSREFEGSGPFGYGHEDRVANVVVPNNPVGYVGDYRVTSSNRGIAA